MHIWNWIEEGWEYNKRLQFRLGMRVFRPRRFIPILITKVQVLKITLSQNFLIKWPPTVWFLWGLDCTTRIDKGLQSCLAGTYDEQEVTMNKALRKRERDAMSRWNVQTTAFHFPTYPDHVNTPQISKLFGTGPSPLGRNQAWWERVAGGKLLRPTKAGPRQSFPLWLPRARDVAGKSSTQ